MQSSGLDQGRVPAHCMEYRRQRQKGVPHCIRASKGSYVPLCLHFASKHGGHGFPAANCYCVTTLAILSVQFKTHTNVHGLVSRKDKHSCEHDWSKRYFASDYRRPWFVKPYVSIVSSAIPPHPNPNRVPLPPKKHTVAKDSSRNDIGQFCFLS